MLQNRNIGLDIARVLAAALVIICHSGFFSVGIHYNFLSFAGILAVEIFFALSGLLVGKSLILCVTGKNTGKGFAEFYVNRVFRTLPLYYLLLLVTAATSGRQLPISCFFFCQNFNAEELSFLPVSWSLSIEAWFYFLIPPVFWLLIRLFSGKFSEKTSVFLAIGILCAIPFALRVYESIEYTQDWDFEIRKQIPLRLDAIMLGVFLAAVKYYYPDGYRRLAGKTIWFVLSSAGIMAVYVWYCADLVQGDRFNSSALGKILVFTLLPVLCCIFVMFMENTPWTEKIHGRRVANWIHSLSILSYGIYLVQLSVFVFLSQYFVGTRFAISWLGFLLAIALTVGIAKLMYVCVEVPVMKLKNKILSKL